ncbi:trypsin-like peptidase domain-containing protein [Elioraea rosea]|uniref:trypsin-like peptidase domain-containing protein n=1 Tax=Elioraea rosea TaxID=2492390 RepID=UPI001184C628|nr:trypsin-like peptidase domain-containing protein [Elioraea rosea]
MYWRILCNKRIRAKTKRGGIEIIDLGPEDWLFDPRLDIAVAPMRNSTAPLDIAALPCPASFITKEQIKSDNIGPGDEVFMIGRFINHFGSAVNSPSVRFGYISVMPTPILQPKLNIEQHCFCIDLHFRTGYSGSPVFIYRTPGYDLEQRLGQGNERAFLMAGTNLLMFLGIHFGQFSEIWDITTAPGSPSGNYEGSVPLISKKSIIYGLSGMTCVLPAWSILEVLDHPSIRNPRDEYVNRFNKNL